MTLLVGLVKTHGASCQALTVGGYNVLHCLLESERRSKREPMEGFLFLLENGCEFCAVNSSGVAPLGTAIDNEYLSIARSLLARITQPHANTIEPHFADAEGNSLLHRLLQEAGYDLERHVNTPNNQGFTPFAFNCHIRTSS
ncbi:hypothetical protein BDN67DRAFT_969852 [Paxillus ammoniavirescens]|nr:hypothetical protein BDN67DRAFT_969852 [Paxillus ammoniavirescens]